MRVERVGRPGAAAAPTLVLLPAAATTADDFVREGFIDELDALGIDATVLSAAVPVDVYAADRVVALVKAQIGTTTGAAPRADLVRRHIARRDDSARLLPRRIAVRSPAYSRSPPGPDHEVYGATFPRSASPPGPCDSAKPVSTTSAAYGAGSARARAAGRK